MGSTFLLSLVLCASLMPVETLPDALWMTAFVLGFVSAVFDNISLTKLCLVQGHYDWGMLAYSVGFGGSMIWHKEPEVNCTVKNCKAERAPSPRGMANYNFRKCAVSTAPPVTMY